MVKDVRADPAIGAVELFWTATRFGEMGDESTWFDDREGVRPVFVVVSGPPASGKSTVAPRLALALQLPLIAKDTIKDALVSVLSVPDVETSRQVGRAAVAAMLAVAAESSCGAVIESNLYRSVAADSLRQLPGTVIEVFCRCDANVAAARYKARAGSRHAGHFDFARTPSELWNNEIAEPVRGRLACHRDRHGEARRHR